MTDVHGLQPVPSEAGQETRRPLADFQALPPFEQLLGIMGSILVGRQSLPGHIEQLHPEVADVEGLRKIVNDPSALTLAEETLRARNPATQYFDITERYIRSPRKKPQ